MTDNQIEQEIQAKGLTAPRIMPANVEADIESEYYFTAEDGVAGDEVRNNRPIAVYEASLSQVTLCVLITRNGTKLVGVNTGPVSAANFDAELGRKLARQDAIDQLWPMLGYEMRSKLSVIENLKSGN